MTLICDSGMFGSSLSSQRIVGVGANKPNVKPVVAPFTIEQRDQLIEPRVAAACAAERESPRRTIQQIAVGHQHPQCRTARRLLRHAYRRFFHARRPSIGPQQNAHAKRLAGRRFAFLQPRAFDAERLSPRHAFHPQRDAVEHRNLARIREQPVKHALNVQCDRQAVRRERIAGSKSILDEHRRMPVHDHFAGKMQRSPLAIKRILREPIENGEPHQQRRKLGMIHHLEMQLLLRAADTSASSRPESSRAERPALPVTAVRWSPVIVPIGPPTLTIFVEARSDESVVTTSVRAIGKLHIAQAQEGMPAQINLIRANRRNRARRADRSVALHQHHPRHVARQKMRVVRFWRSRATLRRNESEALQLPRELPQSFRLIARKNQWCFDGFQRRTSGQPRPRSRILGQRHLRTAPHEILLLRGHVFRSYFRLRVKDVFDRSHSADRLLGENAELQRKRPASLPSK